MVKGCHADVFIIVHQRDTDKIFSFTSDRDFTLEKISGLVLRDVQQGQYLKKNMVYRDTDFELVKRNIEKSQRLVAQQMSDGLFSNGMPDSPPERLETPAHKVYDGNRNYDPTDGETGTEDMSMSM